MTSSGTKRCNCHKSQANKVLGLVHMYTHNFRFVVCLFGGVGGCQKYACYVTFDMPCHPNARPPRHPKSPIATTRIPKEGLRYYSRYGPSLSDISSDMSALQFSNLTLSFADNCKIFEGM